MEDATPLSASEVLDEAHRGISQEVKRIFVCLEHDIVGMVTNMHSLAQDLDRRIAQEHDRLARIAAEKRRCHALFGQLQGIFGVREQHARSPGGAGDVDVVGDEQPVPGTPTWDKASHRGQAPSPRSVETEMTAANGSRSGPSLQLMREGMA
jgi:hypothetical protein